MVNFKNLYSRSSALPTNQKDLNKSVKMLKTVSDSAKISNSQSSSELRKLTSSAGHNIAHNFSHLTSKISNLGHNVIAHIHNKPVPYLIGAGVLTFLAGVGYGHSFTAHKYDSDDTKIK